MKFLLRKEAEVSFWKMLLRVQSATKKIKGEDFSGIEQLIQSAEAAIEECKQMWVAFNANSYDDEELMITLCEKEYAITKLIYNLKRQSNYFRNKKDIDDILGCLETATAKFLKEAI